MLADRSEALVRELLASAGIAVGGTRPFDIQVHDDRLYRRLLAQSALGLGESYMDGWWDCEAVDQFLDRVLRARLDRKVAGDWRILAHGLRGRLLNLQTPPRAREVARRHYDLGNDLFRAMLDRRMVYSCAVWKDADTLDGAQEAKLDRICRKLDLHPGMTVLELGCGWGGFARYAAETRGVSVTAYNVSGEQVAVAREVCAGFPVDVVQEDYRSARGTYDAVVSVGFFEHVGHRNHGTCMEVARRCLKDDGIAFLQTIGANQSTTGTNAWLETYIFPNSGLPSVAQIAAAMEGRFVLEDWHVLCADYDRTLMAWLANFRAAWPSLKRTFDERFRRMWEYYLLSSAAGFRSGCIRLWQIVMSPEARP